MESGGVKKMRIRGPLCDPEAKVRDVADAHQSSTKSCHLT